MFWNVFVTEGEVSVIWRRETRPEIHATDADHYQIILTADPGDIIGKSPVRDTESPLGWRFVAPDHRNRARKVAIAALHFDEHNAQALADLGNAYLNLLNAQLQGMVPGNHHHTRLTSDQTSMGKVVKKLNENALHIHLLWQALEAEAVKSFQGIRHINQDQVRELMAFIQAYLKAHPDPGQTDLEAYFARGGHFTGGQLALPEPATRIVPPAPEPAPTPAPDGGTEQ